MIWACRQRTGPEPKLHLISVELAFPGVPAFGAAALPAARQPEPWLRDGFALGEDMTLALPQHAEALFGLTALRAKD